MSLSLLRLAFIINYVIYLRVVVGNECKLGNVGISTSTEQKGFHRLLIVDISTDYVTLNEDVVIKFNFPSGLYVDPHELTSLQSQMENSFKYHLDAKINVELPEYKSFPFNLIIKTGQGRIIIPFHTRYHKPNICLNSKNGVEISLKNPEIYRKFPKNCLCDKVINHWGSTWCHINYKSMQEYKIIHLAVGCLEHTPFVGLFTAVIMVLGCCYLGNRILKK